MACVSGRRAQAAHVPSGQRFPRALGSDPRKVTCPGPSTCNIWPRAAGTKQAATTHPGATGPRDAALASTAGHSTSAGRWATIPPIPPPERTEALHQFASLRPSQLGSPLPKIVSLPLQLLALVTWARPRSHLLPKRFGLQFFSRHGSSPRPFRGRLRSDRRAKAGGVAEAATRHLRWEGSTHSACTSPRNRPKLKPARKTARASADNEPGSKSSALSCCTGITHRAFGTTTCYALRRFVIRASRR